MSQHTPGPWTVNEGRHSQSILGHWQPLDDDKDEDDGELVTIASTPWTSNRYAAQNQANARLIAAAPDLLEALQHVRAAYQAMFDIMPVAWQTFDDICAQAIAKATEEPAPATVAAIYACPHCHERRLDWLVWTEGDTVRCQSCKTTYHVPEEV